MFVTSSSPLKISVQESVSRFSLLPQDQLKKDKHVPLSAKTVFREWLSGRELARLLQQFVLLQSKRYTYRHLGDEPLAGRLGHLLAEAKVDLTDASTALKKV